MTLKIYGISASRALRPLWTALELGVPFEHVAATYKGGATRTPEFLHLNPNGHIPVVVDERPEGTVTVWESMACALYIARVHGQPDGQSITPASAREEAEAYLAANRFTVADLCVASVANWLRPAVGLLAQYPAVAAWLHACLAREAHKQALGME